MWSALGKQNIGTEDVYLLMQGYHNRCQKSKFGLFNIPFTVDAR